MAHPHAHEFLSARGTSLCRACAMPSNHLIHELPLVEVTIAPLNGSGDPPQFSIVIKDGLNQIARVYVDAEDFALALSGRLVKGRLAMRYNPDKREG